MTAISEICGQESTQVGIGVGDRITEVDNVSIINEFVFEGETIIGLSTGLFMDHLALLILYLSAFVYPANLPAFIADKGKHSRLHAIAQQ